MKPAGIRIEGTTLNMIKTQVRVALWRLAEDKITEPVALVVHDQVLAQCWNTVKHTL